MRRAQLDSIIVKERFKNQVKNCRSYRNADIGSYHNVVVLHAHLKYKKLRKKKIKRFDVSKLKTDTAKEEYKRGTFEEIEKQNQETDRSIENSWVKLKEGILKTAENIWKSDSEPKRKPWISEEVIDLIKERRKYKNSNKGEDKIRYKWLRNEIIRKNKRDKETYL